MKKHSLCIILGIAATFGVLSLSGCSSNTIDASSVTSKIEVTETTPLSSETLAVSDDFSSHIAETTVTEVTQIITEITKPASFNEETKETEVTEEPENEVGEVVEVTYATAQVPEYALTKPEAAGEASVFAENYKQWSVEKENGKGYKAPSISHTAVGKDIYTDLFADNLNSDIVKILGTSGSSNMTSTIKIPKGAELAEYRYIENGEYPYFEQGATYTVNGENYSLNVAFGFINHHYDDEGDANHCVFKDVHDYIDSLGLETYEYSHVDPKYSMHGGDFDDTIFDASVTENNHIHEAVMTIDKDKNTKTMYIMIPVEPGSDLLLQIKLEDNYSDFNVNESENITDSAFVCLCTELFENFKY